MATHHRFIDAALYQFKTAPFPNERRELGETIDRNNLQFIRKLHVVKPAPHASGRNQHPRVPAATSSTFYKSVMTASELITALSKTLSRRLMRSEVTLSAELKRHRLPEAVIGRESCDGCRRKVRPDECGEQRAQATPRCSLWHATISRKSRRLDRLRSPRATSAANAALLRSSDQATVRLVEIRSYAEREG
jgi:hypothetical protein